jgi:TRAP-type C4-dicarboxylate transport system substrate-binding protein
MRVKMMISMVLVGCALLPSGARITQAQNDEKVIRIATLAPRDSDLVKGLLRIDKGLQAETKGEWRLKVYAGGVAGDEQDALRKMRVGQMDGAVVTSVGLSQVLTELAILTTPGVIDSYASLEAVQKELNPEWDKKLDAEGFKMLGWGDIGMLRYFSKVPLATPYDLKKVRPWVWPESHTMKSVLHAVGATGVPLGVPEVYGGLQTGMIDAVITSSLACVALRWHDKLTNVTARTHGPLVGGMVIGRKKWDTMPPNLQTLIAAQVIKDYTSANDEIHADDKKAYDNLLKRGYKATPYSAQGEKDYKEISKKARDLLVGRVYKKELLERVMKAAGAS